MSTYRRAGLEVQGADETIAYGLDTTAWGSSPSAISVVAKDVTDPYNPSDVSSTVLSGTASAAGDLITLPKCTALTAQHRYRLEVKFTDSEGNTWEPYIEVWCNE